MTHELTKKDIEVLTFVCTELSKEGFNPCFWDLKEIPVEDEVYTFENLDDSVEFSAFVNDGKITIGYDKLNENGDIVEGYSDTIIEAIEKTQMGRTNYHNGSKKEKTIFEELFFE